MSLKDSQKYSLNKYNELYEMRTSVRTHLSLTCFICSVQSIYDAVCEYITREWIEPSKGTLRGFATDHDIDEKTARRIKNWKAESFKITLYTLEKMCISRKWTLDKFFKELKR